MNRKLILTLAVAAGALLAAGTVQADSHHKRMWSARGHATMALPDFATLDADGDGKITQAELDAHRTARLKEFDPDGDGFVTRDELRARFVTRAQQRAEAMADRMFERLDTDKDGRISAAEAMAARSARGAGPEGAPNLLRRLDRDGDGAISKEEYDNAAGWAARRGERRDQRSRQDRRAGPDRDYMGGRHGKAERRGQPMQRPAAPAPGAN